MGKVKTGKELHESRRRTKVYSHVALDLLTIESRDALRTAGVYARQTGNQEAYEEINEIISLIDALREGILTGEDAVE